MQEKLENFLLGFAVVLVLLAGCRRQPQEMPQPVGPDPFHLTEANFESKVLQSEKPVLVDFFATWCAPCKDMEPIVRQLAAEFEGRAVVGKLDTDQNVALAQKFRVDSIPTFLVFKDGQVVDGITGAQPKRVLAEMLEAQIVN